MNSLLQHTTVAILYVYKTFNDMQYISRPYDLFLSAPIIPIFLLFCSLSSKSQWRILPNKTFVYLNN